MNGSSGTKGTAVSDPATATGSANGSRPAGGVDGADGGIPTRPGPRHAVIPGAGPIARPGGRGTARPGEPALGHPDERAAAHTGERATAHQAGERAIAHDAERATVRLREAGPDDPPRYAPEWLALREPADAAARAADLLDPLRIRFANLPGRASGGLVIHDLGCGTGSMGRWLAPRLDGAQHWILHDRDPYLLHFAAVASPRAAADGSRVTVETRRGDVARLTPDALTGASLVTASALLDVLTREEVDALADACVGAGCPALLTLSVVGRVGLFPAHPLDDEIAEAFNAHQRRDGLLGPDAVATASEAFGERGATVKVRPSAWRLGPDESALTAQWLRGWVGAAVEQRPRLAERAEEYLRERLAGCEAGKLRVTVHHSDLLALAQPTGGAA